MAEFSMPWTSAATNDGRDYTAAEWDQLWEIVLSQMKGATQGVMYLGSGATLNTLGVTVAGANSLNVATGSGLSKGHIYWNDAVKNLTPASAPAASTRKDYVILRGDWTGGVGAQYTVRLATKEGTAGALPALSQTDNTVWEIALYSYVIDDAGAITSLVDVRVYCHFATRVSGDMLDTDCADDSTLEVTGGAMQAKDLGITSAKLANGAGSILYEIKEIYCDSVDGNSNPVCGAITYTDWFECDGGTYRTKVTPDKRGRMTVGAKAGYAQGATGGAETFDNAHVHVVAILSQLDNYGARYGRITSDSPYFTDPVSFYQHAHQVQGNTNSAQSSTQSLMNPWIGGHFFMYIPS